MLERERKAGPFSDIAEVSPDLPQVRMTLLLRTNRTWFQAGSARETVLAGRVIWKRVPEASYH